MIRLKEVSVHNLKKISLDLEEEQFIVFTGVSGSGKSSLAFDTIHVEGQRPLIDSLSTYAKRYLKALSKPEALSLEGIPPTIAIEQKSTSHNPRSTVGTMTAIYDYLRVLYARLGEAFCPISKEKVMPISKGEIAKTILHDSTKETCILLAPLIKGEKGAHVDLFQDLLKKGFLQVRVDKTYFSLSEKIPVLKRQVAHDIDVVIDTLSLEEKDRLLEAIQTGLDVGKGLLMVCHASSKKETLFSEYGYSPSSGKYYKPLEPEDFSFNHPKGMCEQCHGLGYTEDFDLNLVLDPKKSIKEDCCSIAGSSKTVRWGNIYQNLSSLYQFDLHTPWEKLSDQAKNIFLYGNDQEWTKMLFTHPKTKTTWVDYIRWKGVLFEAKKRLQEASSNSYRKKMYQLMRKAFCPKCLGSKIKAYPSCVQFKGKTIFALSEMTVEQLIAFFQSIHLTERESLIGGSLLQEIQERLSFLQNVGLSYLTLCRSAPSLSGGESQRVRLASQIGFGLVKVAYILDEPSIGLHPKDNERLIKTLFHLRDKGNTVIVVEHDEETILCADYVVDIGPLAGVHGGKIIAQGPPASVMEEKTSLTGDYLSGRKSIPIPPKRAQTNQKNLLIRKACQNNLKNIDVAIPLNLFVAITGSSGSGKSSLITDILYPALSNHLTSSHLEVGAHQNIEGLDQIDKVIAIDQSPIGKTPRSNPATYIKVFDEIRSFFAKLPDSIASGYTVGHFSFNVKSGSCYQCFGMGMVRIDMDFLEDEFVVCSNCKGKRFDEKVLSITYRGKNIHDILEMSVEEAIEVFSAIPSIYKKLHFLKKVGLEYLKLGQSSTTLSGGEAQRIKLAKELIRPQKGHTFYILDEPTTGLHFHDIQKLIEILQSLVDQKNTVVVIEHNLDLIKTVDWVIDLGPEGGEKGGFLIDQGPPEHLIKKDSPTGVFLKRHLEKKVFRKPKREKKAAVTEIFVKKASQNNLKELSVSIPHNALSILTGPSGSGKTTLAIETIYAEGQRRYLDSVSTYAKRWIKKMPKPLVEEISGLVPTILVENHAQNVNPRSTLGTITEIYDYLRVIYTRMGTPYCPETQEEIKQITPERVVTSLLKYPTNKKMNILAPIALSSEQTISHIQAKWQKQGFIRIRLNGVYYELDEPIPFEKSLTNRLEIVIDRIVLKKDIRSRLLEAIIQASDIGGKKVVVALEEKDLFFNLLFAVERTGKSYPSLTHQTFSFNSLEGMCLDCLGLGFHWGANLHQKELDLSLSQLIPLLLKQNLSKESILFLKTFFETCHIPFDTAISQMEKEQGQFLLEGGKTFFAQDNFELRWIGLIPLLIQMAKLGNFSVRQEISPFLQKNVCSSCGGSRLNPLARNVRISGVSITDLCAMPLSSAYAFIHKLKKDLLKESFSLIQIRLKLLCNMGLGYLSLDRPSPTLSGGEIQRTKLAKQLGIKLTGVCYILDEPTIGLHPYNNSLLNKALKELRKRNTLILVEHDPLTIEIADNIYDFGPSSGRLGGHLIAQGTVKQIKNNPKSLTGNYLSLKNSLLKKREKNCLKEWFSIQGATKHNIKNLSLSIPKKALTCITGVSGSGKSTLVKEIIQPALSKNLEKKTPQDTFFFENTLFQQVGDFDKLICIDQGTHKTTIRSDILTYTDLITPLRLFFSSLPQAKAKGLLPKHFSYNHPSGMCKKCRGLGLQIVDLEFLASEKIQCDSCLGFRLNPLSLTVTYKGKHFGHLLRYTADSAKTFFPAIPKIGKILKNPLSCRSRIYRFGTRDPNSINRRIWTSSPF